MENPFKNIVIHLQATGLAAVLIAWIAGVTCIGVYGKGTVAVTALTVLVGFGSLVAGALSRLL